MRFSKPRGLDCRVVIFDLGGVVINFDHHIITRKLAQILGKDEEETCDRLYNSGIEEAFNKGEFGPREFFQKIKSLLGLNINYEQFLAIWNEIFTANMGVSKLIDKLKQNYRIFALSNTNELHFNYLMESFPVMKKIDKFILSYKVGVAKPHPDLYEVALKEASVGPEKIIFIDDKIEFVEQARKLGMNAVHFEDSKRLRDTLSKMGFTV